MIKGKKKTRGVKKSILTFQSFPGETHTSWIEYFDGRGELAHLNPLETWI